MAEFLNAQLSQQFSCALIRVSKIYPRGVMHEALSAMFEDQIMNVTAANKYASVLENITNSRLFYTDVGFMKEDVLLR